MNSAVLQHKAASASAGLDVERIRRDFPILAREVNARPLVYLDNAATSQMPQPVIDAWVRYYTEIHSNVHRGVHSLSQAATDAYEGARRKVKAFINAREDREIVFVRGATEAINLVAHGYGRAFIGAGDEIVISALEHHSNIVPWQMLCEEKGARLRVIPMNDAGELLMEDYPKLLNARTKLVAVTHVSNALGTVNPLREIIDLAHARGIPVLADGAQAAPHLPLDVQTLDCDFYVFSGHKMCAPTGIGVLYARARLLEKMQPYQGGGDMILHVTFEKTLYNVIPYKFEAGTPAIAGAVGLGAAIDYLNGIGMARIAAYEHSLLEYAMGVLGEMKGVRLIGTARAKSGVQSFALDGVHPHDVGTLLDVEGIAVRAGHHCAQPVMQHYCVPATARASFAFYNTFAEIDALAAGIRKVQKIFS